MNVLSWLNSYIQSENQLSDKAKNRMIDANHYFRILAKNEEKFIRQADFSVVLEYVFPKELLVLNNLEEVDKLVEPFELQDFFIHLELLAKILGDYEESDRLEDPKAKLIFETYIYLKSHLKERFPEVYAKYRGIMKVHRKKSTDIPNVECPECGSNQLVSRGAEWQCKKCYRRFTKRRRSTTAN